MIKKRLSFAFLSLLLLFFSSISHSLDMDVKDRMLYPSTRIPAIGGWNPALSDDWYVIFNNPANYINPGKTLHVSEITAVLTGPIFDIAGLVLRGVSGSNIMSDPQLSSLMRGLYASMDLAGPISFGYFSGGGFGIGVFNWLDVSFQSMGALNMAANVQENLLLIGGYTFRIPFSPERRSTLDLGFDIKFLLRGDIKKEAGIIDLFNDISSDPFNLIFRAPFQLSIGFGLDLGIRYSFDEIVSVGLVARDAVSPIIKYRYSSIRDVFGGSKSSRKTTLIPVDLSLGIVVSPPLTKIKKVISKMNILFGYYDILDFVTHKETNKHWILQFGLGLELEFLNVLVLRAAFNEGLFGAGLGLNLTVFKMEISMFGTEISNEPGMHSVYNLAITFDFSYLRKEREKKEKKERKDRKDKKDNNE
jgi:hypothetical protein